MATEEPAARWPDPRIAWGSRAGTLVEAARGRKLAILTGPAISVAARAPRWTELLGNPKLVAQAKPLSGPALARALDEMLLAGESLARVASRALDGERSLRMAFASVLEEAAEAGPVHRALAALDPRRILTTHLDRGFEGAGVPREAVRFLHGTPGRGESYVLERRDARRIHAAVLQNLIEVAEAADGMLCLGLALDEADGELFDGMERLQQRKKKDFPIVALVAGPDATPAHMRFLAASGITPLELAVPVAPTGAERLHAWVAALDGLAREAGLAPAEPHPELKAILAWGASEVEDRRRAVLVAGLSTLSELSLATKEDREAARTQAATLRLGFPEPRRCGLERDLYDEPTGAGLVAARVAAHLGVRTALVSEVGAGSADRAGARVWERLAADRDPGAGRRPWDPGAVPATPPAKGAGSPRKLPGEGLLLDLVVRPVDRGTRASFALVHPVTGERAVVDATPADPAVRELKLDARVRGLIGAADPRHLYLDPSVRGELDGLLDPLLAPERRPRVWTWLETGNAGDHFRSPRYGREDELAGKVNVALASFHFALHYLCGHRGKGQRFVQKLLGGKIPAGLSEAGQRLRKQAEKARRPFEPALAFFTDEAQSALIEGLLEDKATRREFGRLLCEGAAGWLRKESPRAVVVTLREQGAVVFTLDAAEPVPELIPSPAWSRSRKPLSTLSVGDVFRGALLGAAASLRARAEAASGAEVLVPAARFAAGAAAIRTRFPTVEEALGPIQAWFRAWSADPGATPAEP